MTDLEQAILGILTKPSPAALVSFQGAVLASGQKDAATQQVLKTAGQFHSYLCELESKLAAKEYSELASKLDMGAVGTVALEHFLSSTSEDFWKSLILGGLAEGLMVAASRQYVRAWEEETGAVHTIAAWDLAEALWHASSVLQPDLPPDQRWKAIESLLAPAHSPEVSAPVKALLLGRIYQMLLLTHLSQMPLEKAAVAR